MFMRARRRRTLIFSAVALGVAFTSGAVVWLSTAGANTDSEPAAFAAKGSFKSKRVSNLDAEATHSSIRGTEFRGGYGRSKGKRVKIGDGDVVAASLSTGLTPVAVESGDGRFVVYSTWRLLANPKRGVVDQGFKDGQTIGIPSVRIYDDAGGKDELLEVGAYAPALSLDGRLAYVRGDSNAVRMNVRYEGKIVVGSVGEKSFQPWTDESAKYFPYAWAGSTLLAYKSYPGAVDLYAFTGPGEGRLLAPNAFVIAISPDASRVLVTVNSRMVEIIRMADGAIEASMALDGEGVADFESKTTPHYLSFFGSWYGDRVIANSNQYLVVLNVRDGIQIEAVISTPEFTFGIYEPTLIDETHLLGWVDLGSPPKPHTMEEEDSDSALVQCDLSTNVCEVGTSTPSRDWQRWIVNPSR